MVTAETEEERRKREQQRLLFDGVAGLYDATRRGYPAEIVSTIFSTAAIGPGAAVLEIGCGTGQFTRQLAGRALDVTAIDIGAAMVAAARRNVADPGARFQVCSFEDFTGSGPFDLIVSATAFHWIDPAIGLAKAARLLRPGGWLALLATGERYPEPLRTQLRDLWMKYSHQNASWAGQPAWLGPAAGDQPVRPARGGHSHQGSPASGPRGDGSRAHPRHLPQPQPARPGQLHRRPGQARPEPVAHIDLVQETFLAMAPAAA